MNMIDMFSNGHKTLIRTLDDISTSGSTIPGVCGTWSVKDILAHLTSFEQVLGDLLLALQGKEKDSHRLQAFIYDPDFNDTVVLQSQSKSYEDVLAEYITSHERASHILTEFPDELRRTRGLIAWYGSEYDLDDFIAYTYYGHKIEHSTQIAIYRDSIDMM